MTPKTGPSCPPGLFPLPTHLQMQVAPRKRMKQLNPPFFRTHRAILVARIVFLTTLMAGIVFVAMRGNSTSRASNKIATKTARSDKGGSAPSKSFALAPKTSPLTPACRTDGVTASYSKNGAVSMLEAIFDAYPNKNVILGGDTTVTPDAASNVTGLSVSTSPDFKGTLSGDPVTGIV